MTSLGKFLVALAMAIGLSAAAPANAQQPNLADAAV